VTGRRDPILVKVLGTRADERVFSSAHSPSETGPAYLRSLRHVGGEFFCSPSPVSAVSAAHDALGTRMRNPDQHLNHCSGVDILRLVLQPFAEQVRQFDSAKRHQVWEWLFEPTEPS
jgi:hypothetical protein